MGAPWSRRGGGSAAGRLVHVEPLQGDVYMPGRLLNCVGSFYIYCALQFTVVSWFRQCIETDAFFPATRCWPDKCICDPRRARRSSGLLPNRDRGHRRERRR